MNAIVGVDYGSHRIAIAAPRHNIFCDVVLKNGTEVEDLDVLSACLFDYIHQLPSPLTVIEAPIVGASRNIRTGIRLGMVAGALAVSARQAGSNVIFVPPSKWKATVLGQGNANKEAVSAWLRRRYPDWWDQCHTQDLVDATCLFLHGEAAVGRRCCVP